MVNDICIERKLYIGLCVTSFILCVISLIRMSNCSSSVLIIVHVLLLLACVYTGYFYGWKKYTYDRLYEQLRVLGYEKLCASASKPIKGQLDRIVFLTGNIGNTNDDLLKEYIELDDSLWCKDFGKNANNPDRKKLNAIDQGYGSCDFLENYIPVLNDMVDEKYNDALSKLGALSSDVPFYDVPRRFYTIAARLKMGADIDEFRNDISFIVNKAGETRYSKYIDCFCNSADYMVEQGEEGILRGYMYPFFFYFLWILLVNICI
ncbi:MAG: hypothetical protein J5802_07620 [Butyrivibrio sp.]|nr:hypothetical protein [Butyrivibrio sp.]